MKNILLMFLFVICGTLHSMDDKECWEVVLNEGDVISPPCMFSVSRALTQLLAVTWDRNRRDNAEAQLAYLYGASRNDIGAFNKGLLLQLKDLGLVKKDGTMDPFRATFIRRSLYFDTSLRRYCWQDPSGPFEGERHEGL